MRTKGREGYGGWGVKEEGGGTVGGGGGGRRQREIILIPIATLSPTE